VKAIYDNSPGPSTEYYYHFENENWQHSFHGKFFSPETEEINLDIDLKEFNVLKIVQFEVGFTTTTYPNGDGSVEYFTETDPDTGDPLPDPLTVAILFAFANVSISVAGKTTTTNVRREVAVNPYSQPITLEPAFYFGQVSTNPRLDRLNFIVPASLGEDEQLIREYLIARVLEQYSAMSILLTTTFRRQATALLANPYAQFDYDYGRGVKPFRLVRGVYDLYTEELNADFIEIKQP
jgi:hypothetical protein